MPSQNDLHDILSGFKSSVLDALDGIDLWDIEGEYDAMEKITELKSSPEWKAYQKESKEKNSRIWELVKALFIPAAIGAGIATIRRDYKPQLARQVVKEKTKGVVPKRPTAKDYANQYIRERGGEFITNMSRTDQKKLVDFIWSNGGEHERPQKNMINNQPHLRYVLDQGRHREETIVRTEKARATRYGSWSYAKDWGAKTKTRQEVGDARTRPSHRALMGETVPINDPYSNGEQYPGETDINCRGNNIFNF